jgi:hypothetical protein
MLVPLAGQAVLCSNRSSGLARGVSDLSRVLCAAVRDSSGEYRIPFEVGRSPLRLVLSYWYLFCSAVPAMLMAAASCIAQSFDLFASATCNKLCSRLVLIILLLASSLPRGLAINAQVWLGLQSSRWFVADAGAVMFLARQDWHEVSRQERFWLPVLLPNAVVLLASSGCRCRL